MSVFLGDGDGFSNLAGWMYRLENFSSVGWEYAVENYASRFCYNYENLDTDKYDIEVIPFSKRDKVVEIWWNLKKIKWAWSISGSNTCGNSFTLSNGSLPYQLSYEFRDGNTGEIEEDYDTDYNRHLFIIGDQLGEEYYQPDGESTPVCTDPPDTPTEEKNSPSVAGCGVYMLQKSPQLAFRYLFDGDITDRDNCAGYGFIGLCGAQTRYTSDKATKEEGHFEGKRVDYINIGSIVPTEWSYESLNDDTVGQIVPLPYSEPEFISVSDVNCNGIDLRKSHFRDKSFMSSQGSPTIFQDGYHISNWSPCDVTGFDFK